MRTNTLPFRLTTALSTAAILVGSAWPMPGHAQPAPPGATQDQNQPDPPARVGRLAQVKGTVSYHAQNDSQWSPAVPNYPVAAGGSFWTEPGAQATLEVSSSRIAMDGGSEFDLGNLEPNGLQATLAQGKVYLRLRDLANGETWTLHTPRGSVVMSRPGQYEITAGDTASPTTVAVIDGAAEVTGPNVNQSVGAGQVASISGNDAFQANVGPYSPDAFASAMLAQDHPPVPPPAQPQAVPPPPMVAAMPGGQELSGYGSWNTTPEYGQVWYPSVEPGWVPYREGHWAYIAPWGWTWVDDAPWGFAPFHYGRWVEIGHRWAWTPGDYPTGRYEPPVYAPALVTFLGIGAGLAIGAALASGSIGWVPLGPREAYHPWFHASSRYYQSVNVYHVRAGDPADNGTNVNNFHNRAAATMVPAAAMAQSRPIHGVAQPVSQQAFAAARPVVGQQPIRPTFATAGVTPAVARQLNLAPTGAVAPRPAAPGPVIRAQAPRVGTPGAIPGPNAADRVGAPGPGIPGARPSPAPGAPTQPGPAFGGAARPAAGVPAPGQNPQPAAAARPEIPGARPTESHAPGAPVAAPAERAAVPGAPAAAGPHPQAPVPHFAAPQVQTPPPAAARVQPAAPAPQVQAPPAAAAHVQSPAPAPNVQAPAPQVPHVQAPAPAPAPHVQAPPPPHVQAPPPAVHVQAPPPPHVQAPPPQFHAAPPAAPHPAPPPPRPAAPPPPAPHAAPPPAPHPAPPPPKKPGEK